LSEAQFACNLDDLPPSEPTVVAVKGREYVLTRVGAEVYALRNICPHQSVSFLNGRVRPRLRCANPESEVEIDNSEPLLLCPWHSWAFSLRDGTCPTDPSMRVASYTVTIEDGRILIGDKLSSAVAA
jgi:nitrite reductase (NADH) small subunit